MMLSPSVCLEQQRRYLHKSSFSSNRDILPSSLPSCFIGTTAVLLLLLSWLSTCQGIPVSNRLLQTDQELQFWNEIDDACSTLLALDAQPQASSALEEICFMVMRVLQKYQDIDEKDNNKRFLFHYSKSHDSGNSDIMSVLHPLLQLVPQLHERRTKRFRADEELQGPGGIQSRGYFLFRPRNGRRSETFP